MQTDSNNKLIANYLFIGGLIVFVMMLFGVMMLLTQGGVIQLGPATFYQFLTIHGTGMIGACALAASGVMWYFLNKHVVLSKKIFITNLICFLIGVVMVIVGVFSFDYASAWTFLYPLPTLSAKAWGTIGALLYLFGMLIIGIGFLLLFLDIGRAIIKKQGSLAKGLGWDIISGKKSEKDAPHVAIVAATMVTIVDVVALLVGATVLMMNIIHTINPAYTFDPLLAKNFTYAFGHVFANSIIYMSVIVVYELLSKYTNRQWKANKVFLIAWTMSTFFTLIIYTHHLLMDSVMPRWMLITGQVLSYANGLPVLVITAYGALMIVYKSGIKWDIASGLTFIAMFGWTIGVVPAIVDATIVVNHVMHNTKWVPGHFHMYMGLGAVVMLFAFMYYLTKVDKQIPITKLDWAALYCYLISMFLVSMQFLVSGAISTPRRWATHIPEWMGPALFGGIAGIFVMIATSIFIYHFMNYFFYKNSTKDS
ncbi:cbb3-type cytochrome c oxidase subunit I [Gracilibacillus marinus]|uniref:Cbb3-type cytochrome c oxidase subunit I n=1 Tax=Gracilibacillus marinus TaxID=630535 RepID=A0ABV8VR29_9BACI